MLAALVGACSSDDDASTSSAAATTAVPGTTDGADGPTYVVQAGDALSTIGDAYGVTARQIVDANDWSDGIAHVIQPGQTIRLPSGAALRPDAATVTTTAPRPPTTTPAASASSTTVAAAITTSAVASGYEPVATPRGPEFSAPIDASWVQPDGTLIGITDGQYWATAERVAGDSVEFQLSQAFFDDACRERFATVPNGCEDGIHILTEPTGTITMSPGVADVIVCDFLAFPPGECYRVTGAEFTRLVGGGAPSAGAPADFQYTPSPVFVTVRDGAVTAVASQFIS